MASKFWVGGGTNTNWNSSPTTNWANTSGGTGNQTAPATGDDVTFDNASGTGASNWNTAISLNSLICTNSRNTVSGSAAITISGGNLALPGGVGSTYAHSGTFTLSGTSGTQQITSNGKNFASITLNGVGGTFQLQDNLNCSQSSASTITLTNGTLDCQTFTVSTGLFVSSVANTRTLKGSGLWTVGLNNATGAIWSVVAGSLTSTNFTSSITISGTTTFSRTFAGGGLTTYGTLTIGANSSGGPLNITGANTFAALAVTAPNYIVLTNAITQTITAAPTIAGSAGSEIGFLSNSVGTSATISIATGTPSFSWCAFHDITCSGGATFTAKNSFDLGHNSGITISAPANQNSMHSIEEGIAA